MLWGGMSSCAQHHNNNCLERLVLRSAPHVFRRGRYRCSNQLSHKDNYAKSPFVTLYNGFLLADSP